MNKITIIGSGSVGATISYTLAVMGFTSEIVMIDINNEKAVGEALDIRQALPFCNPCTVNSGSYSDAANSDIVIITSGVARKAGQSRLELAQTNIDILKQIMTQITHAAPDAVYLLVSNPVDILTYAFCKRSGIPESRIIGSGTILDTARLRAKMSEFYSINQHNAHAYVLGEHGDSSFIPWSLANVSNVNIADCHNSFMGKNGGSLPAFDYDEALRYVQKSGGEIIARKGATFYAVSTAVCYICKSLLSGMDTTMTVSTMLHGEYGIDDVCLSTLSIVGNKGVRSNVHLPLNDEEIGKLRHSAETLKAIIKATTI